MMWESIYEREGRSAACDSVDNGEDWRCAVPASAAEIIVDVRPTILIAGPQDSSALLGQWAERAGLRCAGCIGLEDVAGRLEQMVAIDAILLDIRGAGSDDALRRMAMRVQTLRNGLGVNRLAIILDEAGIDDTMAWFDAPGIEFLCDPQAHEILSLLVMTALSADRASPFALLHDATRDSEAARIERLSEEVRRLAATIEQLTVGVTESRSLSDARTAYAAMRHLPSHQDLHGRARESRAAASTGRGNPPTPGEIRALLRARRMRDQFLPGDLFADPAWDMILDLLAARLGGQRVSVSSLCIAASVPPTTALRWIRQLTERGILSRIDDPEDGRRVFIDLTEDATEAVVAWAQAVRRNGGLLSGIGAI